MNQELKRYLISSAITFAAAFLGSVSLQLSNGIINIDSTLLISIGLTALRVGIKVVVEQLVLLLKDA